ncbi:hypothetical protein [Streptomyces sp. NPDC127100]
MSENRTPASGSATRDTAAADAGTARSAPCPGPDRTAGEDA